MRTHLFAAALALVTLTACHNETPRPALHPAAIAQAAPAPAASPAPSPTPTPRPSANAAPANGPTTFAYTTTIANPGPCNENLLTIMVENSYPAYDISYTHGEAPPLMVSNCNFTAGHIVQVTLDTPAYGAPFIAQYVQNSVAIDAPGPAAVLGTWTDMGDPLEGPSHGVSGQVYVHIR